MPSKAPDYVHICNTYCNDVLSNKQLACKWIKLACERHVKDLARSDTPEFTYRLDPKKVHQYCSFIELLPHIKGSKAGQRFHLEPFQVFIVANLVGWVHRETGYRRFREALLMLPRKSGKSFLASAMQVAFFCLDPDIGKEIYSAANTEKQAWYTFGIARQMVLNTPQLQQSFGIEVNAKSLVRHSDGSKFVPCIGRAQDGGSPSAGTTLDEHHEADDSSLFDCLKSGQGSRKEPQILVISTAGVNLTSPCYSMQLEAQKILEGSLVREDLFAVIYTTDEKDDWSDFNSVIKANPNLGVSNDIDFLKAEQANAIRDARAQARFRTKYLNQWLNASSSWMNMHRWSQLADLSLKQEDFVGEPCCMAGDLSSKLDIAAIVKVFKRRIKEQDHYYVFGKYYLPAERANDPASQHYNIWVRQKFLRTTEGNCIDYSQIAEDTIEDINTFKPSDYGFDPWNATQFAQQLAKETPVQAIEIPQQVRYLSDPMKTVEALVVDGRIHHDGNPVLAWCMSNVVAHIDAKENVFPRKERNENKIDGAVALIMAISRITLNTTQSNKSFEMFFV